jgi:hypothetical protein
MSKQSNVEQDSPIRPDAENPWLHVRFQDQHGRPIGTNGFRPSPVWLNQTEASQLEGYSILLDDNGDTLVVTVVLEDRGV